MDEHQRREMTRVPIQFKVTLRSPNVPAVPGKTTDISLKGLHVACDNPLPVGSSCQLTLTFGSQESPIAIELEGTVVRADRTGMALEIAEALPIDTVTHLQNIVRYNATAPDRIDQELHDRVSRRWGCVDSNKTRE